MKSTKFSDIASEALKPSASISPVLTYIEAHPFLERDDIYTIKKLLKELSGSSKIEECVKILNHIIESNFPHYDLDADFFDKLIAAHEIDVIVKLILRQMKNNEKFRSAVVQAAIKNLLDRHQEKTVEQICTQAKAYGAPDFWKPTVEQELIAGELELCGATVILMITSGVQSYMTTVWERFLSKCVEMDKANIAFSYLGKLKAGTSMSVEGLTKLTNFTVAAIVNFPGQTMDNVLKCLTFAKEKQVTLQETELTKVLILLASYPKLDERGYISALMQTSKMMTARTLNNLNSKLIEMSKLNVALSLFNMALNKAFPKINEDDIDLPTRLMKKLVVLQQHKIMTIQKTKAEEEAKEGAKTESKKVPAAEKKVTPVKKSPEKEGKQQEEDEFLKVDITSEGSAEWEDYVLL